ncbi:unnamed protein product [Sphagnum balticum]
MKKDLSSIAPGWLLVTPLCEAEDLVEWSEFSGIGGPGSVAVSSLLGSLLSLVNHVGTELLGCGRLGSRQQVWLAHHPVNVQIHDRLRKLLVVKQPVTVAVVFSEERSYFLSLKVAPEFVERPAEGLEVDSLGILQVEVGDGLFGSFPFVSLAVALLPNFFEEGVLDFSETLR